MRNVFDRAMLLLWAAIAALWGRVLPPRRRRRRLGLILAAAALLGLIAAPFSLSQEFENLPKLPAPEKDLADNAAGFFKAGRESLILIPEIIKLLRGRDPFERVKEIAFYAAIAGVAGYLIGSRKPQS